MWARPVRKIGRIIGGPLPVVYVRMCSYKIEYDDNRTIVCQPVCACLGLPKVVHVADQSGLSPVQGLAYTESAMQINPPDPCA